MGPRSKKTLLGDPLTLKYTGVEKANSRNSLENTFGDENMNLAMSTEQCFESFLGRNLQRNVH